jgi:mevalonate kinase
MIDPKTRSAGRGKVILFGEHAVVYGIPAIAVGIDRGARASATALASGPSTLRVREWNVAVRDDDLETLASDTAAAEPQDVGVLASRRLVRAFADLVGATRRAGIDIGPMAVEAEADLPPGGGLGCSAALGVAVARALDPNADADAIAERVGVWESVFHGNASGVDAAVSALGGCVQFERGEAKGRAKIERVRLPGIVHLCIGNTGQRSSTRSVVEAVGRLRARRPETTQRTFEAIHTLVKNARLAIEAGDRCAVGQLLDLNQMLLAGLFVSTPEIEQMCSAARSAGAFGAKLTGAGGGGCVVALVDSAEVGSGVLRAWKSDGFDGFLTTVGSEPVRRAPAVLEGAP